MSRAQRRMEQKVHRSRERAKVRAKVLAEERKRFKEKVTLKKVFADIKEFFEIVFYDDISKLFGCLVLLSLVVILAMTLNGARARHLVSLDNQTYEVTGTYIIDDEIKTEAEKNNMYLEDYLESRYNKGLANFMTISICVALAGACTRRRY